jgi:NADPH2:quinone reductase
VKAAVYYETGGPEVFRYEELPDPPLHPRGVLIDVKAVSIEGGDILHRAGGEMTSRPHIVGYQCAGVIREAGPEVEDLRPGDRVVVTLGSGSHASVVSVPARATWKVPGGLSIEEAACVPIPFGTADDCLFEFGRLKAGETVLVQGGAGGVGLALIQLAKRAGATVIATASSDDKLARLREYGLDHGVNYREKDFVQEVRALTGGRGVDLAVDPVGGATLEGTLKSLAYRGRAVTVGNASRGSTMIDARPLLQGNQSLTGVYLGPEIATPRVREMIQRHLDDVARGELKVVIDRTFPLSEAAEAHRYIESRQAFGRVLLIP